MAEAAFTDGVLTVPFELDPGVPGWPKITGTVRPATAGELRKYDARLAAMRKAADAIDPAKDPVGFEKAAGILTDFECEFYANHITSWGIGEVTAGAVAKLPPQYYAKLDSICFEGSKIVGN
jgi:hypothetical protein